MKETLQIVNRMQRDGAIGRYALGGAVAASLYLEPFTTKDLDIFVVLPTAPGTGILSLSAIYDYLVPRGFAPKGQFVEIGSWLVDFIHATTPVEVEALDQAVQMTVDGAEVWVMRPEHLVAICLTVGRSKDFTRILQFLEQEAVDGETLRTILVRHQLERKWEEFERKFLDGKSAFSRNASVKDQRRRELRLLAPSQKSRVIEELRDVGVTLSIASRSRKTES